VTAEPSAQSVDPGPAAIVQAYRAIVRQRLLLSMALLAILLIAFLIDVASGPAALGLKETIGALLDPSAHPRPIVTIIWDVRLPQAVAAILVGIALALAGAEMRPS
jgi:iron complex transport system permease protein